MSFQLGSDLLEACVLGVVSRNDTYGYDLTQNLQEVITISDSTTYPILRRLTKNGYLDVYDQPYQGRNRRYYTITDEGRLRHEEYIKQWVGFKEKIDEILVGGGEDD